MSTPKPVSTVTIAGLTGRISRLITYHLLQTKPSITIHGIVRTRSKLPHDLLSHPNLKIFEAISDDKPKLIEAVKGSDVCICGYFGGSDIMVDGQKTLIDCCIEAGVPRYVASDWCLDYRDLEYGDHPMKDPMKTVADYLQTKSTSIKGIHVLNGAFTEALFNPLISVYAPSESGATFSHYGDGNAPYALATYSDAARFTAEIACDPSATGYFNIVSDRISTREIAEVYARVYGVEVHLNKLGEVEEAYEKGQRGLKESPQDIFGWARPLYMHWMQRGDGRGNVKESDAGKYPGMGRCEGVEEWLKGRKREDVASAGTF